MKLGVYFLVLLLAIGIVSAVPNVGDTGVDPTYGNEYIVCRADTSTAWVAHNIQGGGWYNPRVACDQLGYSDWDLFGGTCGTICGYCGSQGLEHYDGSGHGGVDALRYTVQWRCTDDSNGGNEVPEFGIIGGLIAVAGVIGFLIFRRK